MMTNGRNEVLLEGTAQGEPSLSHEARDVPFYRLMLEVPRLSGQSDLLPLLLRGDMLAQVSDGARVRVSGQFRSYNNRSGEGRRLVLSVYALALLPPQDEACNRITLVGALCKPPVFRRTPLGRSICDLMLAVPRRCGRADYLPLIAWGQLAARTAALCVGDPLALSGRIQSRLYRKVTEQGEEVRTAYEVSVMELSEEEQ
ncbi:MAG: single-stranded DNA-binding protein [Oscillibacter sp.]|nr:single-stranded DNA-binding protein [Oscillibacter sp.]